MSIARPAAEIEPHLSMFSSNAIFPGPIRPSGSRSIRTLREGSAFDFCMEEFNSPIAKYSFSNQPDHASRQKTGASQSFYGQTEPVTYSYEYGVPFGDELPILVFAA